MTEELIENETTRKLCAEVRKDVESRQRWLNRQSTWYKMRHDGIPRGKKPWPHATDLHYPLADSIIDKFKPFYFNQLFGTEVLAQFAAIDPKVAAFAQDVGYWFDYELKQKSNIETEVLIAIDKMLMAGHAPIKVVWDADEKRLAFDAIEPTHCIVPDSTEDIQKADRITIVHHMTPGAYKRDPRFQRKDADFIERITGNGKEIDGGSQELEQNKEIREGLTHGGKDSDLVIIWETWENTEEGWWVHFYSPLAPELPVRVSQPNPFLHKKCPIVRFDCEIKDKGHYASRGVPEKVVAFEKWLCRMWNEKGDAMSLYNRPIFGSTSAIPNAGNIQMRPGQIIPGLTASFAAGRPPFSFDEEMQNTRGVAEQTVGTPDYGIGANDDKNEPRTLGEVKLINAQHGTGIDLRSRVFRLALGQLLQLAWDTVLQYDPQTQFYIGTEAKTLPPEVLKSGKWMVKPNGSSESWDKGGQLQKAMMMKQVFVNSAAINQPELDKLILEREDPRLVARLWMDPGQKARSESEDENALIPAMLLGAQFQPKPEQDQAARIMAVMQFIAAEDQKGIQLPPDGVAALQMRVQANLAMLKKKNPQQAQQIESHLQQAAQSAQPPQTTPDASAQPPA